MIDPAFLKGLRILFWVFDVLVLDASGWDVLFGLLYRRFMISFTRSAVMPWWYSCDNW